MEKLEVVMVAASRVGKTSLLAAMYEYIKPAFDKTPSYIQPVGNTINELQQCKIELYSMFDTSSPAEFSGGGVSASVSRREYKFQIGKKGQKADLELVFVDLPGGYYTSTDEKIQQEVKALIKRAFATFLPIDIAALLADEGKGMGMMHQKANQPEQICNIYSSLLNGDFKENNNDPLIIIIPIKCERFLQQSGNNVGKLFTKLIQQEDYLSLLKLIASPTFKESLKNKQSKATLAFCPVQTIGGIHVIDTRLDEFKNPEHILKRVGSYSPKNCHLPILYLFYELLRMENDRRRKSNNFIWQWIRDLFKLDAYLKESISIMVKDLNSAKNNKDILVNIQDPCNNENDPMQNFNLILEMQKVEMYKNSNN